MLTEKEVLEIANKYIDLIEKESKMEMVILESYTISKPYGNIFFYLNKKRWEDPDSKEVIAGNAPFLIEKETGNIIEFGTAYMPDYYIAEYEAGRWPKNERELPEE